MVTMEATHTPAQAQTPQWEIGKVNSRNSKNLPYISPTPGRMPIVAYQPMPNLFRYMITDSIVAHNYREEFDEIIRSVKECGFNTVLSNGYFHQVDALFTAARNAKGPDGKKEGLATILLMSQNIISSFRIMDEINSHYRSKNYPDGILILDEPQYNDWGQVLTGIERYGDDKEALANLTWNRLTNAYAYLTELNPDKLVFASLGGAGDWWNGSKWIVSSNPPDRSPFSGNCKDTDEYLEALQLLFRPAVWCYDAYPFVILSDNCKKAGLTPWDTTNDQPEYFHVWTQSFYHNLERFCRQSQITGRPFWAYCMSSPGGNWNPETGNYNFYNPFPTKEQLRFEAFNALASGAQGILFWSYGMGDGKEAITPNSVEYIFSDAPLSAVISKSDNPDKMKVEFPYRQSELWNNVKTVVSEILKLEPIFFESTVKGLGHYCKGMDADKAYQYGGLAQASLPFGPVTSISPSEEGLLLSHIEKNGEDYLVIANHDAFKAQNNIRLRLADGYDYEPVWDNGSPADNTSRRKGISGNKLTINIPAGNFFILKFKKNL